MKKRLRRISLMGSMVGLLAMGACSDPKKAPTPDSGGPQKDARIVDSTVGGQDGAAAKDTSAPDTQSNATAPTDWTQPHALPDGTAFSSTVTGSGFHYFKFTARSGVLYRVDMTAPKGMQVGWCAKAKDEGCMCQISPSGGFATCCSVQEAADGVPSNSCQFTLEASRGSGFATDTDVFFYVANFVSDPAPYTLTITAHEI